MALRRFGTPILAAVLALVLFLQVPVLVEALSAPAPAHDGTVATDAIGDRCVANLWVIADSMAEHRPITKTLECPASGVAYVTSTDGSVTVVSCPNPGMHKAGSLSVRSDRLVPAVR